MSQRFVSWGMIFLLAAMIVWSWAKEVWVLRYRQRYLRWRYGERH